ncbi:hypothetical protein EGW08_020348 [Elysia chlorotica]|uniref:G-protein coupled receptors family 1 profile domain-containing protein n=1 Tax=Elysia chlorotica TaxID=188477 RepID=A0A3S0ZCM2_ELYCH|nr:hypothetical protein EGW08_020348 [Elysia chlorotica]
MDNDHQNDTGFDANNTVKALIAMETTPSYMEDTYNTISSIVSWIIVVNGTLGLIGNILTVVVYTKLGFSETIHMSYVALAISDFFCLLTLLYVRFCFTAEIKSIFLRYRMLLDETLFANFTGAWPNHGFTRTTALLTAWISLERCLCVLFPTRVKLMITPRVTKIVLTVIFTIGCCPVALAFIGIKTEMDFDPETNYTTLILRYSHGNQDLNPANRIAFVLYGALYPIASWLIVVVCAFFLITALKRSARWRSINTRSHIGKSTGSCAEKESRKIPSREARVTRTVVVIACAFIFFSLPISATVVIAFVYRDFSVKGYLHYPLLISVTFSFLFGGLNSSINIVVYTLTGSKFRSTLIELFKRNHS